MYVIYNISVKWHYYILSIHMEDREFLISRWKVNCMFTRRDFIKLLANSIYPIWPNMHKYWDTSNH